jgi:hypothetical protein
MPILIGLLLSMTQIITAFGNWITIIGYTMQGLTRGPDPYQNRRWL